MVLIATSTANDHMGGRRDRMKSFTSRNSWGETQWPMPSYFLNVKFGLNRWMIFADVSPKMKGDRVSSVPCAWKMCTFRLASVYFFKSFAEVASMPALNTINPARVQGGVDWSV